MRKLLVAVLFLIGGVSYAQQKTPTASFDVESHDFGKIKESDGPVSFRFTFRNTGGEPLILNNVHASCGCTTPNYSKEPVLPGAKGYIDVTFNPQNRGGNFEKSITVSTNGDPETIVLKINGEVIAKSMTSTENYQYSVEGLRFKSNQISFSPIYSGQKQTQKLEVLNDNDKPVTIDFTNVPKHLQLTITPKTLKPKEKGLIEATYDTKLKNDWDFVTDQINFRMNGKSSPSYVFSVNAIIYEDFSNLTEDQRKNAARIEFPNNVFEFGAVKAGEKVKHEFTFKNNGKSDLVIHKVTTTCGCTVAEPKNKVIKPGESSSIAITFNSAGQRIGPITKAVKIITNDPSSPAATLMIKGTVENPNAFIQSSDGK